MPTIKENKFWDEKYLWPNDGDEWDDQAKYSNSDYHDWKQSIADNFIFKYLKEDSIVLEMAPGHGRWTELILKKSENLILVDLNLSCINYCKNKFKKYEKIKYYVNDGKSLGFIKDNSIDFIWSYDSFVHMERDVIECYFKEFSRILKKDSFAIIHHPGRKNTFLFMRFLKKFGNLGKRFYNLLTLGRFDPLAGWRSDVSNNIIKNLSKKYRLKVVKQIDSWGENKKYNVKLFYDQLSIIHRL